jgi:uncharacterized protein
MINRRQFGLAGLAFAGLAALPASAGQSRRVARGYGALVPDPAGLLDLPPGFSYQIISKFGDAMDDGLIVPDRADGMGAFALDARHTILVRNHELRTTHRDTGPFTTMPRTDFPAFDRFADNGAPLPGGTTTLIYDQVAGKVTRQHLSLVGTIRNCAGGTTPWGSWLSCEEDVTRSGNGLGQDHGWVFEVPAKASGIVNPAPLTALGRFNHEAAAVDPASGIVYLTEDRPDSLFYRFIPDHKGELAKGGKLQALALRNGIADSRNWSAAALKPRQWLDSHWIDLTDTSAPDDDLRQRGSKQGALIFARGEGIWFGRNELYFCCTSGGAAKLGQVFRYRPSNFAGQPSERGEPGRLQLFIESSGKDMLDSVDNLTIAPNGHLILCEDQPGDIVNNRLHGVTPQGSLYDFARLHDATELAGACFTADGRTMFVNLYSPARTLAITGPWGKVIT